MVALVYNRKLAGTILLLAFLAPAAASGVAAAIDDCCPNCPTAPPPSEEQPCHGSPLLVCCDDVATASSVDRTRVDAPALHPVEFAASHARSAATAPRLARLGPPDLRWSTSGLRRSVILRL